METLSEKLKDVAREWTARNDDGSIKDTAWFGQELHSLLSETSKPELRQAAMSLAAKWKHGEVPENLQTCSHDYGNRILEEID